MTLAVKAGVLSRPFGPANGAAAGVRGSNGVGKTLAIERAMTVVPTSGEGGLGRVAITKDPSDRLLHRSSVAG